MFKDKKLNRLWEKAELAGFTTEEMTALKEEFEHHQDKIDVYYNLLENLSDDSKANVHESKNKILSIYLIYICTYYIFARIIYYSLTPQS